MERQIVEKKCDNCGESEQFPAMRPGEGPKPSIENWITLMFFKVVRPPQGPPVPQQINKQACKTSCAIELLKQHLSEKMGATADQGVTKQAEDALRHLDKNGPTAADVVKH
jgi:hypothetical protein